MVVDEKKDEAYTAALKEFDDTHHLSLLRGWARISVNKLKIGKVTKDLDDGIKESSTISHEIKRGESFIEACQKLPTILTNSGIEDIDFQVDMQGDISKVADDVVNHCLNAEPKMSGTDLDSLIKELRPFASPEMKERLGLRFDILQQAQPPLSAKFILLLDKYVSSGDIQEFSKGLDAFEKALNPTEKKAAAAERRVASQVLDKEPKPITGNAYDKSHDPVIKKIEALKHYCEKKGKKDKSYLVVVALTNELIKDVVFFGGTSEKNKAVTERFMTGIKNRLHTLDDKFKHKDPRLNSIRQGIIEVIEKVLKSFGMLTTERKEKLQFWSSTKTEKGIHKIEDSLDRKFSPGKK